MITKEAILQRIKRLEADREKLLSSLNATEGALQDCQYWLSEIDKTEAVDKE
jgi:hypothetical protein